MKEIVLRINKYLGYDFNTVELALRDGVPYAIDFCNPAPDADIKSVGQENFDWVVETAANYAIEKHNHRLDGVDNLTWGSLLNGVVTVKNYNFVVGRATNNGGQPATALTKLF